MKVGDLVKRASSWVRHNPWMAPRKNFVGIIYDSALRSRLAKNGKNSRIYFVLWSTGEIRIEDNLDIEVINESR